MFALSVLTAHVSTAASTKNVLVLSGVSRDLPGSRVILDTIESTVRRSASGPTEFYVETVDTGRFAGEAYERKLVDLFQEKYKTVHFDLVVVLGEPAAAFVARERAALFQGAPLLFGLVGRTLLEPASIPPDAGAVLAQIDTAATLRLALAIYPRARNALVVGGSARIDRGWQRIIQEDLRGAALPGVAIAYDFESPLETLTRKVAALPADTIVLYTLMTRDGTNASARPVDALESLRRAARVPIFGISSVQLGHGITAGVLLDFDQHGAELGRQAVRLLRGEAPAVVTTPQVAKADWRELQRFNIPESSLPASTVVVFRETTMWESQKRTLGAIGIIVAVETVLILGLVRQGNRRRDAQRQLEARLRFERRLSTLSVSLATVSADGLDDALESTLGMIAADVGADGVWRWTFAADGDGWDSAALRAGQQVTFTTASELPRAVRERVAGGASLPCSCLAIPVATGGAVSDVLFWLSYGATPRWEANADKLRVVSAVVAAVLQGRHAEAALERSDRLKSAILDSLPAHVAVLDRDGIVIGLNEAWIDIKSASGLTFGAPITPGDSYIDACTGAARTAAPGAARALSLIKRACRGERSRRQVEYRGSAPDHDRWFLMTAEPLRRAEGGAVVTHADITERKLGELALRESEKRFREAEQRLRDLNRRLIAAQEDERRRIARELHDHLNQQLALLAIDLQQLALDPPTSQAKLIAALHDDWRRTTEIASDVHGISHRLHPSKLETLGLVATLRAHCRDVARKSVVSHFSEQDMPAGIPPDASLCLFRVAEEALANVARHSGAPEAFVTLVGTGSDVTLRVADSGSGFDDGDLRAQGLGLVSMRERVQALGGSFSITSVPGKGTIVEARVRCVPIVRQAEAVRRAETA